MLATLWANQIMLGKRELKEVPRLLKGQVVQVLVDFGYPERAEE